MKEWCKNLGYLQYVSLALLLSLVLLTYTNRVDDLDLWWHLKSGEAIVKSLSLPKSDAFSYTTGKTITLSASDLQELGDSPKPGDFQDWGINLSQSWLGQVIFYLAYALGGVVGVGLLKVVVFMLTFFVLFWTMRKKGAGPLSSLLVIFLVSVIGQDFALSRPQIFTLLLIAVLFYLFADFKRGGRKIVVLPAVFLAWSNIHGGFTVGAIILLIFWGGEVGKYFLHTKFKIFGNYVSLPGALRMLSYSSFFSLLAMLLNPNHYKVLQAPFAIKGSLFASIEEYVRPMLYEYHAYWLMLVLVLLLMVLLIRVNDPTDVLLLTFLVAISQMGLRGIILFAVGAAPFLAASLSGIWQWLSRRKVLEDFMNRPGTARFASYLPQQIIFLIFLLFFGFNQVRAEGFMKFSVYADNYPGKAVAFMQEHDFPGRLFNPYNWGGYLIWQYPQRQVFIDGRCLDEQAYFQSQLITIGQGGLAPSAPGSPPPLWKRLLDDYGIQVVLTNAVDFRGGVVPLVDMLALDPDWALVYQDGTSLVFLRDSPSNRSRYRGLYLDKRSKIFDEIVSECQRGLVDRPALKGYYELLGSVYLMRKESGNARKMFEKYLEIDANNTKIIQNLNLIRKINGEAPLPLPQQPNKSPHHW